MPINIQDIKQKLDTHLGEELTIVAQAGRKKVTRRRGILTNTFPAVFVVALDRTVIILNTHHTATLMF